MLLETRVRHPGQGPRDPGPGNLGREPGLGLIIKSGTGIGTQIPQKTRDWDRDSKSENLGSGIGTRNSKIRNPGLRPGP